MPNQQERHLLTLGIKSVCFLLKMKIKANNKRPGRTTKHTQLLKKPLAVSICLMGNVSGLGNCSLVAAVLRVKLPIVFSSQADTIYPGL